MSVSLRAKASILGLLVMAFGLAWQPTSASAEVAGSLPPPAKAGVALVVYTTGGTPEELREELIPAGCGLVSTWVTVAGRFVGHTIGAPAFVNASFTGVYPGAIPAGTPLIVVCREGGVGGPDPTSTRSDPSKGLYVCGPAGNEAIIEITFWDYYPRITEASSNQAFMEVKYRFPNGASDAGILSFIRTGIGWPSGQDIEKLFGVENPLDPSGLGLIAISAPFPRILQNPTAPDHLTAIVDGNEHVISWDKLKVFTPGKAYFEAYVRGDLLHGERPDVSFTELASALGATDPYALAEPPVIVFTYTMPDGKVWGNTFEDLASCDYTQQ